MQKATRLIGTKFNRSQYPQAKDQGREGLILPQPKLGVGRSGMTSWRIVSGAAHKMKTPILRMEAIIYCIQHCETALSHDKRPL